MEEETVEVEGEEEEKEEKRRERRKKIEFNSFSVTLKFFLTKVRVQTIPELIASQACYIIIHYLLTLSEQSRNIQVIQIKSHWLSSQ